MAKIAVSQHLNPIPYHSFSQESCTEIAVLVMTSLACQNLLETGANLLQTI